MCEVPYAAVWNVIKSKLAVQFLQRNIIKYWYAWSCWRHALQASGTTHLSRQSLRRPSKLEFLLKQVMCIFNRPSVPLKSCYYQIVWSQEWILSSVCEKMVVDLMTRRRCFCYLSDWPASGKKDVLMVVLICLQSLKMTLYPVNVRISLEAYFDN